MPRRARGLTGTQFVPIRILVRATEDEAEKINSAANDAGMSVSRYVVQAAFQRANAGAPSPAEAPSRFDRRGVTLRRLRRAAPPGTPERLALAWAAGFYRMLREGPPAAVPPAGCAKLLAGMASASHRTRHRVVEASLSWASRMASWAETLSAGRGTVAHAESIPEVLSRLAHDDGDADIRWAFRATRFLNSQKDCNKPERPRRGAAERLRRYAVEPGRNFTQGELGAIEWAARLAEQSESG